jgi:hypothetical protein
VKSLAKKNGHRLLQSDVYHTTHQPQNHVMTIRGFHVTIATESSFIIFPECLPWRYQSQNSVMLHELDRRVCRLQLFNYRRCTRSSFLHFLLIMQSCLYCVRWSSVFLRDNSNIEQISSSFSLLSPVFCVFSYFLEWNLLLKTSSRICKLFVILHGMSASKIFHLNLRRPFLSGGVRGKTLHYKSESRGFGSRWGHWDYSLT